MNIMNKQERERKWTVNNDGWMENVYSRYNITQGYLSRNPDVRVRIESHGGLLLGYLIVKGDRYFDDCRDEFTYEIPVHEADMLLDLCRGQIIRKTRYLVNAFDKDTKKIIPSDRCKFEIDVFDEPDGIETICEMEYSRDEDLERVMIPDWLGDDVTGDESFYNHSIGAPLIS